MAHADAVIAELASAQHGIVSRASKLHHHSRIVQRLKPRALAHLEANVTPERMRNHQDVREQNRGA